MKNTNLDILASQAYQRYLENHKNHNPKWKNEKEFIQQLQRVIVPEIWDLLNIEVEYTTEKQNAKFKYHGEEFIVIPDDNGITIKSLLDGDEIAFDYYASPQYSREQILVFLGSKENKLVNYSFTVALQINITAKGFKEEYAASDALDKVQKILDSHGIEANIYGAKRSNNSS